MKLNRIITVLALFSISTVFASAQVSFNGIWTLNESKSNFGDSQFRMAAPTVSITQDAGTFTIERTYITRDGQERKTSEKYTLDGKESVNPAFNTTKKSVATWSADKKELNVASSMVLEFNGESSELKTTEVYKLTEGLLTVSTKAVSSRGEISTVAAYDKKQ